MVVLGGQQENGVFVDEMLALHLDNIECIEWVKIGVKNPCKPFIQSSCC